MKYLVFLIFVNSLNASPSMLAAISNNVPPATLSLPSEQVQLNRGILLACELDRTNWIAHLLQHGANPNASRVWEGFGATPLQIALNRTSKDTIRLLVNAGATNQGLNAVHLSAILNDTNGLAALITKGVDLDQQDASGASPKLYAFNFRNAEALTMLIAGGAKHMYRPMQLSVIANDLTKITTLSRDAREVNGRNGVVDFTPLMLAAIFDHPEACKLLIENDAELEAQAASRGTALMLAVENGSHKTLRELLRAGADPNHIMGGRYSPLTYAVWKNDLLGAKLLLDAGANPDLSPGDGFSARAFARSSNSPAMLNLFDDK